ncbi:hypothetical protein VUR80DRAFT_315 [Thermomyces stellatus]
MLYERRMERKGNYKKSQANTGKKRQNGNTSWGAHPEPMELDATQAQKKKACFNCGKEGHFAKQCRQKKKSKGDQNKSQDDKKLPEPQEFAATQVDHASLIWTRCYNDDCTIHQESKEAAGWYPRKPKSMAATMKTVAATYGWNSDHQRFRKATTFADSEGDNSSLDEQGKQRKPISLKKCLNPEEYRKEKKKRQEQRQAATQTLAATTTHTGHPIIDIKLNGKAMTAMVDSGATGLFVSPKIVNQFELPYQTKEHPYNLAGIDGKPINYEGGCVRFETAQLEMTIGERTEQVQFDVTNTGQHPVVLGLPWLQTSNPKID